MRDLAKTLAIGVSAGLFALAVAQAQPGCDAGGTDRAADAPAKAEPAKAEPAKAEPAKAEPAARDDAIAPALGAPPDPAKEPAVEPAADPAKEAAALSDEATPDADAKAKAGKRAAKPRNRDEPDAKVFLPATKSGAFLPREPPPQQQANAAPTQQ